MPAWRSPWLMGDIEVLERVYRKKAAKMVSGLKSKENADTCAELGLETMEKDDRTRTVGLFLSFLMLRKRNLFPLANRPEAVRTRQAAGTKSLVARFARTD